jgi:hypothetical protein
MPPSLDDTTSYRYQVRSLQSDRIHLSFGGWLIIMLLDSTQAIIPHSEGGYPKQQTSATGRRAALAGRTGRAGLRDTNLIVLLVPIRRNSNRAFTLTD